MKKIILFFFIFIFKFSLCEGQSCLWVRQGINIGHNSGQLGYSVATDNIGNVFLTGTFNDTVIFGMDTLYESKSIIACDIYLVKYDSSGNELWAKSSFQNTINQPQVQSVMADNRGNSYITGNYNGTIHFDLDSLSSITGNAFYVKYGPAGNVIWAETATPASHNSEVSGHCGCPDNKGNSYLTGTFYDTATFGSYTLYSIHSPTGFLVKYDVSGNVLWAKKTTLSTGSSSAYPFSISTDKKGNAYVAGYFNDTVSFGMHKLYSGSNYTSCFGMFLAKYDTNGNVIWATGASTASSASSIYGTAVSTDENGNSYITGYYLDTIYFGSHTISIPFTSLQNMFLVKYDSSGNIKWVRTPTPKNSKSQSNGQAVSLDNKGNVYVSGHMLDTVSFQTDTLIENANVWYYPSFFTKYDSSGNLICAESFANGQEAAISADSYGNFYFGGSYIGLLNLKEDTLINSHESAFLSKWKSCIDSNITTSVTPISNKLSIALFPNPTTGAFTLQLSVASSQSLVEIYNVLGERVYSKMLRSAQDDNLIELNQPNGIYLYRIISESGNLLGEGKVVVQK